MKIRELVKGKRGALLLLAMLGTLGAVSVAGRSRAVPPPPPPAAARVDVVSPAVEPLLRQGFSASATLEALENVVLVPKVSGKLRELRVSPGDRVRAGQVLAVLDHRDQDAQVGALSAQTEVNRAGLEQARAELEQAQRERDRYRKLLAEGYATKQDLDTRVTTLQTAQAAYQRAAATVRQSQANLQAQQVNRSEFVIQSPMDGVVLRDYDLAPGALLGVSSPVLQVAQTRTLKAVIQVPENQLPRIREGMTGLLTGEGFPGREVAGTVRRIDPYVDPSTRTARVEVQVPNGDSKAPLKPGMFAKVFLVEATAKDALTLPPTVIRDGGVFVVEDGTARRRAVTTGLVLPDRVQILSGVASGDRVVVEGGDALMDGDRVLTD